MQVQQTNPTTEHDDITVKTGTNPVLNHVDFEPPLNGVDNQLMQPRVSQETTHHPICTDIINPMETTYGTVARMGIRNMMELDVAPTIGVMLRATTPKDTEVGGWHPAHPFRRHASHML